MPAREQPAAPDLIIMGAQIIDGTGAPRRRVDVSVGNGRIEQIAEPGALDGPARRVIDGTGRILSPGFIDVHTHDDHAVLATPEMTPKISQGVTTVIAGNCGISIAPLTADDIPPPLNLLGPNSVFRFADVASYAQAVDETTPAVNVALLVGHGSLRHGAMNDITRKANAREIDVMRARLDQGLAEGAIGLSTGLYYPIARPADMDEVVALAELLPAHHGVYTTHMRDEHDHIVASLEETFETASRAHVRAIISHHKCAGPDNWGRSHETLAIIDAAAARQPVGLDAYPYVAGSTILEPEFVDERVRITISWSDPYPEMAGRDLIDIAADWGVSQHTAAERLNPAGGIFYIMSEDDVRRILAYPETMIGSDGLPKDAHPHPRLWGTFPRVLGHYCREVGLFDLESAVRKMTGLAAANFGLTDRGVIRQGAAADLVLFDADAIIDTASFDDPKQPAAGIDHVIVNGVVTWSHGTPTGERAGRFVRNDRQDATH